MIPEHFWYGYSVKAPKPLTRSTEDLITVYSNNEVTIPKGGYHLFLLEAYTADKSILELDLVCEWNGKVHFTCMYRGHNVYYFKMPVIPGHGYLRRITFKDKISYDLVDTNTEAHEHYEMPVMGSDLVKTWRGVEWHGLVAPFRVKYNTHIRYDPSAPLVLEKDKSGKSYPVEVSDMGFGGISISNKDDNIVPILVIVAVVAILVIASRA